LGNRRGTLVEPESLPPINRFFLAFALRPDADSAATSAKTELTQSMRMIFRKSFEPPADVRPKLLGLRLNDHQNPTHHRRSHESHSPAEPLAALFCEVGGVFLCACPIELSVSSIAKADFSNARSTCGSLSHYCLTWQSPPMGFYYRKSVKLGPFRVNLSKSGVGCPSSEALAKRPLRLS
jgi:hypothetical protein